MGDPTEVAVLVAAAKAGVTKEALLQQYTVTGENPFDAARKRMSVTVSGPGGVRLLCKGAPDMLLARCTHIANPRRSAAAGPAGPRRYQRRLCPHGGRSGCACWASRKAAPLPPGRKKLCFLGLMGMGPAPGPEVRPAVQRCREAGIKPVMITGDYKENSAGHCPGRGHRPRGGRRARARSWTRCPIRSLPRGACASLFTPACLPAH